MSEDFNQVERAAFLKARYGTKEPRWKFTAIVIGFVFLGWTLWSANHAAHPDIRSQLISFNVRSDSAVEISYSLQFKDPSKVHTCRLVARDFQKNVVGELRDEIPTKLPRLVRTVSIPTRTKAVNAGILSCN
jgi:hypothetical protein